MIIYTVCIAVLIAYTAQHFQWVNMTQTKNKKTTVSINFEMSAETNQALTLAAKTAKRSKHVEAALRLEDHIRRFKYVGCYEKNEPHS